MKKALPIFTIALALFLTACGAGGSSGSPSTGSSGGAGATNKVIKVGATAVPHAEILEHIKPELAKEGIDLQVVTFSDYAQLNPQLVDKQLDANYFQHIPYLENFNKQKGTDLEWIAKVHIEPMGVYSKKIKAIDELKSKGGTVAIPNDATNGGRALALLAKAGVIQLKEGAGITATVRDIVQKPDNLTIKELDAAMLPRALDDVTAAVINTNYALEAKLNPKKDALFLEDSDSPYANVLVVRKGDEKRPEIVKLARALTSDDVKKFIEQRYQGSVIPTPSLAPILQQQ
ncbi:MAG: MetQ/NlpA family ABC transporter substrate-binding protein [Alicyclobacillaceae bacterium]|nr:MetQ/NlpA family ABC transporter substrate-binding protein [Alicyclobacillaceae bacterium]